LQVNNKLKTILLWSENILDPLQVTYL
jgi:hypothetical protein